MSSTNSEAIEVIPTEDGSGFRLRSGATHFVSVSERAAQNNVRLNLVREVHGAFTVDEAGAPGLRRAYGTLSIQGAAPELLCAENVQLKDNADAASLTLVRGYLWVYGTHQLPGLRAVCGDLRQGDQSLKVEKSVDWPNQILVGGDSNLNSAAGIFPFTDVDHVTQYGAAAIARREQLRTISHVIDLDELEYIEGPESSLMRLSL